ncbi:RNA polymerase sigma factor [Actinomarinicola tropica]|nr:sigma-70 family RNA polymerase sigma factor [Actinomarinicola tropica]
MDSGSPRSISAPAAGTGAWPVALVDEYRHRFDALCRLATMLLGSSAEAEEIVQEAFMATARRGASVRNPGPYVRRAVVNGTLGVHRRRQTAARRRPDPAPPDAPVQLVELRDLLLDLPERQRTVLVLRYVEDLADDEIAATLGCRPATVRSLAARGLAAIRKEMT